MHKKVREVAPLAHFIRSKEPPVMGAVLLGMETAGLQPDDRIRSKPGAHHSLPR